MVAPLALYRRYRPATFAEVVGQEQVTGPLQRALAGDRVGHAYLFSGPRGCGKTTSARILARSVNCELGPTPTPCGVCRSCVELAPGGPGSVDVVEIDAASHGRVDDTRDLRERVFFAPVAARRKIYIIDEAHMVTTGGFNALLKVVEEPPEYLTFIFATTEPEKVLPTIRSRTHHYPFRLIPPRTLSDHLASIAAAEHLAIEPAALALVVRAGGGSARDSLSVLDQLMAGSGPEGVTYDGAVALLGYTPESLLDRVVDSLAAGDGADLFAAVGQVVDSGQDPRRFAEDLLRRLRDLVMIGAVPGSGAAGLLEAPAETVDRLISQQARFGQAHALRAAELVDAGLTEIRGATAPRLHLELLLARLLLPAADGSQSAFAARLERIERRLAAPAVTPSAPALAAGARASSPAGGGAPVEGPGAGGHAASGAGAAEVPELAAPEPHAAEPEAADAKAADPEAADAKAADPEAPDGPPQGEVDDLLTTPGGLPVEPAPPAADRPAAAAPGAPRVPGSLGLADLRKLWDDILEHVKGRSRIAHAALVGSQVVGIAAGRITVSFANEGMRANFTRSNREPVLQEALAALLALQVEIDTVAGAGDTPHAPARSGTGTGGDPGGRRPVPPRRPAVGDGGVGSGSDGPDRTGAGPGPDGPGPRPDSPAPGGPASGKPAPDVPAADTPAVGGPVPGVPEQDGWPVTAVLGGPPDPPAAHLEPVPTEADDVGPDDPDFDDPGISGAELLTRELGAEVIAEHPIA